MNTYYIATTSKVMSQATIARLEREVSHIDPSMSYVGPINIPGNHLTGWITRPNDGTNNHLDQAELNKQAAELLNAAKAKRGN